MLKEELEALEAQKDQQLLDLAKAVLQHTDPEGTQAGKYDVRIYGGQGITVGDHTRVSRIFQTPPDEP